MKNNVKFFEKRIGGSFHYQDKLMDEYARSIRNRVFLNNVDYKNKDILDFGTGDGHWALSLWIRGAKSIMGVEQSKKLASRCLTKCFNGLDTVIGQYDIITCITSFNFTLSEERNKIIKTFYKLLRKNGRLVILDYLPDNVPEFQKKLDYKEVWTNKQTISQLSKEGFKLEKNIPVNWIDTTLFHYFGVNKVTYFITYLLDLFTPIMIYSKYKLHIYKK